MAGWVVHQITPLERDITENFKTKKDTMKNIHSKLFIILNLLLVFLQVEAKSGKSLPKIDLNFTALTGLDSQYPFIELPNANGAVGETQYDLSSYHAVRSFDKRTGKPGAVLNTDFGAFLNADDGDPRIDYHRFLNRWFISGEILNLATLLPNVLSIAMSNEAIITPSTQWSFYNFSLAQLSPDPTAQYIDYNQPATDQNAYYNSVGVFDVNGNFVGSTLLVIPNSSLLAGTPNVTFFPGLFPEILGIVAEGFGCPANNFDANPEFGYYLWSIYDLPDSTAGKTIQLYRILNAGSSTPTLGPVVTITLLQQFAYGLIDTAVMAPHKGNLFIASGTAGELQTGLGRLWTPHVRDKQLYVAQDIQMDSNVNADPSGDRVGVRWYQFDLTGTQPVSNVL